MQVLEIVSRQCVGRRSCTFYSQFTHLLFIVHTSIHRCVGRRACTIGASASNGYRSFQQQFGGDPCPGWRKWLKVDAQCDDEQYEVFERVECDDPAGQRDEGQLGASESLFVSHFLCQEKCEARRGCTDRM